MTSSTVPNGKIAPPNINCGTVCAGNFDIGSSVTLTASPTSTTGALFSSWAGDCASSTSNTCTLTMDSAKNVSVNYVLPPAALPRSARTESTYALTVHRIGQGHETSIGLAIDCGTVCTAKFPSSTQVTILTTAATDYHFTSWSGCTSTVNNGSGCKVLMSAAKDVTVTYTQKIPLLGVTIHRNGVGTVMSAPLGINCGTACANGFPLNSMVGLTALAGAGYTFTGWSGGCTGSDAGCTLTMDAIKDVTANFTVSQ